MPFGTIQEMDKRQYPAIDQIAGLVKIVDELDRHIHKIEEKIQAKLDELKEQWKLLAWNQDNRLQTLEARIAELEIAERNRNGE